MASSWEKFYILSVLDLVLMDKRAEDSASEGFAMIIKIILIITAVLLLSAATIKIIKGMT